MAFSPGISSTSRPLVIEIESDSVCDQAASAFCVSDARDGLRQTAAAAACPIRLDERKQCRQDVSQRIRRFLRGSTPARSARELARVRQGRTPHGRDGVNIAARLEGIAEPGVIGGYSTLSGR
jgi:class 3 adenylate cyclase